MQASHKMQEVITKLAGKAGLDLERVSWFACKFELNSFMPLVIEQIGPGLVSVAHYRYKEGDAIADPEIVFLVKALPSPLIGPVLRADAEGNSATKKSPTTTPDLDPVQADLDPDQIKNTSMFKWWLPLQITHSYPFGPLVYAEFEPGTGKITRFNRLGQAELANFADMWATNIEAQGWFKTATVARCQFTPLEQPSNQ